MKKSKYLVISLAFILMLPPGCTEKDDFPVFRGSYFGQNPPGSKSQLFMPGLISTNYIDHCVGFLRNGRVCVFSIKDGRWTQPESFRNLAALTHLNLNFVPLQSLPKSMSNLSNLKFLWIMRDKFYDPLPEEDLLSLKQLGCIIFW